MTNAPMYQISALQALALGYTRGVIASHSCYLPVI